MKTILITGINGFLGSNLARELDNGYNIIGTEVTLGNLYRLNDKKYSVYGADDKSLKKLFEENNVDIVIHTATFYGRLNEKTSELMKANTFYPLLLLEHCVKNKVLLFINTDTVLDKSTSAYSMTKAHFLDWLLFYNEYIKMVNVKLEHFYGPGCPDTNFVTRMIKLLKSNMPFVDLTHGEQERDFVYYSDTISAFKTILNNINSINEKFSSFNVSTGRMIQIKELMLFLHSKIGSTSELRFGALEFKESNIDFTCIAKKNLIDYGWTPTVDIYDGLNRTISHHLFTEYR
ncbi:MAG: NAD-dependent epimerase/dehydratase family protein [Ignavibacteriaceae bacterium]|nr:NAD-dependent epimerase/dehydratase family protein [Ignavibacteriaceae bacterium]